MNYRRWIIQRDPGSGAVGVRMPTNYRRWIIDPYTLQSNGVQIPLSRFAMPLQRAWALPDGMRPVSRAAFLRRASRHGPCRGRAPRIRPMRGRAARPDGSRHPARTALAPLGEEPAFFMALAPPALLFHAVRMRIMGRNKVVSPMPPTGGLVRVEAGKPIAENERTHDVLQTSRA